MLQVLRQFADDAYPYYYTTDVSDATGQSYSAAFGVTYIIVLLAVSLVVLVSEWKMLVKAGRPGWACLVPIYNSLQLIWMAGKPWWWILLLCVPLVNIVVAVMLYHALSKAFGKGVGMTLLLIFFPFIGFPILGFGSDKYQGPAPANNKVSTRPAAGVDAKPAI